MSTPYVFERIGHPEQRIELERVTTITGILDKPGLPHYYAKVVKNGVASLLAEGHALPADGDKIWDLLKERQATPWYETKRSQERGTYVHNVLEDYLSNPDAFNIDAVLPDMRGYVEAGIKWAEDHVAELVGAERTVWCLEHGGYAGTVDVVYQAGNPDEMCPNCVTPWKCNGPHQNPTRAPGLYIADFKTGKEAWPSYHFQVAAYAHAYKEMTGTRPQGTEIVLLREGGTYQVVEGKATEKDWLALVRLWQSLRGIS